MQRWEPRVTVDPAMTSNSLDIDDLLAHSGWVRSLALRLVKDAQTADDVVQDTWMAALRHPPGQDRPLRPWLGTVVRNLVRRRQASEKWRTRREQDSTVSNSEAASDELLAAVEEQQRLAQDVMALPEPYRNVLLRRYWREQEPVEIARELDIPAATVRSQLRRGLEMLRESVQKRFGGEERAMCVALLSISGDQAWRGAIPLATTLKGILIMNETTKILAAAMVTIGALFGGWKLLESEPVPEALQGRDDVALESTLAASEDPTKPSTPAISERETIAPREEVKASSSATAGEASEQKDLAEFRARLLDEGGSPLANAELLIDYGNKSYRATSQGNGEVILTLDERGTQRFRRLNWQTILEASAKGHVTQFLNVGSQEEAIDFGDITLELAGRLSGDVVDERGRGVANALVQVSDLPLPGTAAHSRRAGPNQGRKLPSTRTNANGQFHIDGIEPGTVRLWASVREKHFTFSEGIEVVAGMESSAQQLVLGSLADENMIAGRVVDEEGKGLHEIFVSYQVGGSYSSNQALYTENDGSFEIVATVGSKHRLTFESPMNIYTPRLFEGVMPGTTDLLVTLQDMRYLELRVAGSDGRAITEFKADLELVRGSQQVPTSLRESKLEGARRMALPAEPYFLSLSAKGYRSKKVGPLDPKQLQAVYEVELEVGPVIAGRVTCEGKPLEGVTVTAFDELWSGSQIIHRGFVQRMNPDPEQQTTTDEQGRFVLDRPEHGGVHLIASAPNLAPAEVGPFSADSNVVTNLEIQLSAGGSIEGVVTPEIGQSAKGQLVSICRGDGVIHTKRSDEEGRYAFDLLTPGDWYVLWHSREAPFFTNFASPDVPQRFEGNCLVREGFTTRFDIDLNGQPESLLRGQIDLGANIESGWTAALEHVSAKELFEPMRPVPVNADGSFELSARPGNYRLRLEFAESKEVLRRFMDTLELDQETHDWKVRTLVGSLQGSIESSQGAPLMMVTTGERTDLDWNAVFRPEPDGGFELGGIPVGEASVYVMKQIEGESFERWHRVSQVQVEAGGVTGLDL